MPETKNSTSHVKAIAFIDYKPAELRINNQWLVVYYAKNPVSKSLERFRVTIPLMQSKVERLKYGKKIVLEINKKLETGWLPFYSGSDSNEFRTFNYCTTQFLDQTKKEVANNTKRSDTLRSYTSYISMIEKYCIDKKIDIKMIFEFNKSFVVNYLDWIYFDRKNSPRTYNNHLGFILGFVNYCISRGWLKENFCMSILKKKNASKIRQILTVVEKEKVKRLQNDNFGYFTLCMATYFCFIRRTELTKLKVEAINLQGNYITINEKISKNRKTENVTIPNAYLPIIAKQILNAKMDDFIFSDNDFKPGKTPISARKISYVWSKFRIGNKIGVEYQFYSLKDTGITDLLNSGMAAIKVRDQARHHDLKITESYTPRNQNCDESIKNSSVIF